MGVRGLSYEIHGRIRGFAEGCADPVVIEAVRSSQASPRAFPPAVPPHGFYDERMDDAIFDAVPGAMGVFAVVFGVLFVGVLIFIIVTTTRKWKAAKEAGYDPLTMETQIAAQAMKSELMRPAGTPGTAPGSKTLEERLSELHDLHARGLITDAEHAEARTKALQG